MENISGLGKLEHSEKRLDAEDVGQIARAMCEACLQGDLENVKSLLDLAKSIGQKSNVLRYSDEKGRRALHHAVLGGSLDVVKYLDKEGALWCVADNDRNYPIHHALETSISILTFLLQKGTNPNTKNGDGLTILHLVAGSGNLEVAEIILNNSNVRLDNKSSEKASGNTALHLAVKNEHLEMVEYLFEKGASVNIQNENGSTSLHVGAFTGNAAIMDFLIKHGAIIDVPDKGDKQPLHAAVYTNKFEAVKVLVEAGADVNALDGHGFSPLHIATLTMECSEMMQFLIEHGADVNLRSRNREETPILVASSMGHVDGIEVLLENGSDIDSCDINGSSVLHKAITIPIRSWAKNPDKTVQLLVAKGAKLDKFDDHGYSPLHVCAFQTTMHAFDMSTLKLLTSAGAFARASYSRQEQATSPGGTVRQRRNSPLCWLVWDNEFAAADYLVAAGWDLRHEDWLHLPGGTDEQNEYIEGLLLHLCRTRPLIVACRDSIREALSKRRDGREILSSIDELPLPNTLKNFLKLNDL